MMAYPFEAIEKFTQTTLIDQIKPTFEELPDGRSGDSVYQKNSRSDAALSAFSVFFMQSPSFWEPRKPMQKERGKNNAQSWFGVHQIPGDNPIRNLLDGLSFETLWPLYRRLFKGLEQKGKVEEFQVLAGSVLVALAGVEYFSSQKIHGDGCSTNALENAVFPYGGDIVIVCPNQSTVIPPVPEFIQPRDGSDQQDYELAVSKRWLAREGACLASNPTLWGEDWYSKQAFCEPLLHRRWHFILVCKPDSHQTLSEWVEDFERTGQIESLKQCRWTGKQHLIERYRLVNQVPLRDPDEALLVNWCELEVSHEKGDVVYRNALVTDYPLNKNPVEEIVSAGRTRWKIEDENNNTLKTKGYHFKHNFDHGQKHRSALLARLIILAFVVHTIWEWFDKCYQLLQDALPSRKTFFNELRALTRVCVLKTGKV